MIGSVKIGRNILNNEKFKSLNDKEKLSLFYMILIVKDKNIVHLNELSNYIDVTKGLITSLVKKNIVKINKNNENEVYLNGEFLFDIGVIREGIEINNKEREKIIQEYGNTSYKFEYWKEVLLMVLDVLEDHKKPLKWAFNIGYKVREVVNNERIAIVTRPYVFSVAKKITESCILNDYVPSCPIKTNGNDLIKKELEKVRFFLSNYKEIEKNEG